MICFTHFSNQSGILDSADIGVDDIKDIETIEAKDRRKKDKSSNEYVCFFLSFYDMIFIDTVCVMLCFCFFTFFMCFY